MASSTDSCKLTPTICIVCTCLIILMTFWAASSTASAAETEPKTVLKGLIRIGCGVNLDGDLTEPPLCCQGRNNSCVARGPSTISENSTSCFCDSECLAFGDCCVDYVTSCPAVDCQLADEWSEWSECDTKCGPGLKHRRRPVLVAAQNGGKRCTERAFETAACEGQSCKHARASDRQLELKETGRIVPAMFATWRHDKLYSPFQDIRKNLFEHYGNPTAVNRPTYCAKFELVDVHSTCRKMSKPGVLEWPLKLTKGATLCVECQSFAMQKDLGGRCRGHGVYRHTTAWRATTVSGCHGKWKQLTPHSEECNCDPKDGLSFVLV